MVPTISTQSGLYKPDVVYVWSAWSGVLLPPKKVVLMVEWLKEGSFPSARPAAWVGKLATAAVKRTNKPRVMIRKRGSGNDLETARQQTVACL
jgi:hypothetical protein